MPIEEDGISYLKAVNLKGRSRVKRYKNIQLSKQAYCLIKNNLDVLSKYTDSMCYVRFASILKELKIEGGIVEIGYSL